MNKVVPDPVRLRKSKRGFGLPYANWLSGTMKEYILDTIRSKSYLESSFFNGKSNCLEIEKHYANNDYSSVREKWPTIQLTLLYEMFNRFSS